MRRFCAAIVIAVFTVGLSGCDPKPRNELGLRDRSIGLVIAGGRDDLRYWRMDGSGVAMKSLEGRCTTNAMWSGWEVICNGTAGKTLLFSPSGKLVVTTDLSCMGGSVAISKDRDAIACWDPGGSALTVKESGLGTSSSVFDADKYGIPAQSRLNGSFPSPLSWTPDSSSLYFSSSGRMFVYSRTTRAVTELAVRGDWPSVSPDGTRFVYRDRHTEILAVCDLKRDASPELLDLGPLWYPPSWSSDGTFILANEKGAMKLVVLRLSDRKRQTVRIWDEDLKAQFYALVKIPAE